ncbi:ribbon-helix-helix protein, CopG family [Candidatus Gottesmanbacteria bacterium]|nr:ribbon-helix-helix protein, CopG family [Candidatus Gottesmanbacteria bacterium]
MSTFTISLPDQVARQVDVHTRKLGFSTRSEFMRSLLRRYFTGELSLSPFIPKPLEEIKSDLVRTGKYDKKFIDSVVLGLSKSSPYAG